MSDRDPQQARRELVGLLAGERDARLSCDTAMLALADASMDAIERGTPVPDVGDGLQIARACSGLVGQYGELLTTGAPVTERARKAARGDASDHDAVRAAIDLEDLTARFAQLQAAGEQLAEQLRTEPPQLKAVEPPPNDGGLRVVPPT